MGNVMISTFYLEANLSTLINNVRISHRKGSPTFSEQFFEVCGAAHN